MLGNKEQYKLFIHIMVLLKEEVLDYDIDNAYNQLCYSQYSTTRNQWVTRTFPYNNEKQKVCPLIPALKALCEEYKLEFFVGVEESVTCVEVEGETFQILG